MAQAGQHPPSSFPIELHCHSTASDGTYHPARVVAMAAAQGVRVLALTDHDTTAGIAEAVVAAAGFGMTLIPGVELTCSVDRGEVHLLGYFVAVGDDAFQARLATFRDGRDARGQAIVEKLNALGIPVRWERVKEIAGNGAVGRPHVGRALIEVGAAADIDDAFDRYLGRGRPAHVERQQLLPADAVQLVRAAGGVPVLAHPLSVANLEATVDEMIPAGLLGIEAYYGAYTPDERESLAKIAARHDLITTVGNDFHGDVHGGAVMGGTQGPADTLDRLVAAAAIKAIGSTRQGNQKGL
ncbi:MAG: PHP domain-containing protein [Chloroflexota bacterium]|nr:PHP domain-containing protein [Chloroflexota bacterium]MDQ6906402.1 PHP domain-containing protein [Chloroflexota bacterium]